MRAACAALLLAFSCALGAQPSEHQVKAAFLFKFLSFVEWPAGALGGSGAPIVIGVVGADRVVAELEQIVPGRTVQGRPVQVRRLYPGEWDAGLHVIFFGEGQASALAEFAREAPARPVLVVCEWEGALAAGAVVNFVRTAGRVRFEVAADTAERRGLRISSRMLAVAHRVQGGKL